MPVSLCAEPRAACVCRYCLSTSTVCLASPSCLLREGAVVLPADAIVWVIPLPCPSPGAILQSHVVLKGKRWVSFVGDIWISENFVPFLTQKATCRQKFKNGCAPFSPLPAGMSVSIFCGAVPLPLEKPAPCNCFFPLELFRQTWHTVTCSFYCISEGNGAYPLPWLLGFHLSRAVGVLSLELTAVTCTRANVFR